MTSARENGNCNDSSSNLIQSIQLNGAMETKYGTLPATKAITELIRMPISDDDVLLGGVNNRAFTASAEDTRETGYKGSPYPLPKRSRSERKEQLTKRQSPLSRRHSEYLQSTINRKRYHLRSSLRRPLNYVHTQLTRNGFISTLQPAEDTVFRYKANWPKGKEYVPEIRFDLDFT